MLQELWSFLKNPFFEEDENTSDTYRLKVLLKLLVIALISSIVFAGITELIAEFLNPELGKHAIEEALENYSPWFLLFGAVVLAPLFEEFFFRGPMVFFRDKSYFKYIFYVLTLIFGFIHISNFEITKTTLLLSPILVAPQISAGFFLGFIRVRFGLIWAMVLHSLYNLILIGPLVVFQLLDIPIE
ncbi:CPBP family intramembrane metalloprotease [Maribacter algarum]|uniref:CPBP family intramembrane metalloprotease n=1 Tax=Maribacter algarum (ex Zhang et al. 2020) TaxID=2578118 RepID=A0A5S3PRV5_9FLAO|nr:CPBP family intramembrane glutamic endopeptidase [Maribacter algarum]TMM57486.1 CPBP family intramembrane metalloprotease [Maribacter algarum]